MEEGFVDYNSAGSPAAGAVVSHSQAQELLADLIDKLGSTTSCYWWQLHGEDPNSLSRLLDISGKDMRLILRKCRILYGASDSF